MQTKKIKSQKPISLDVHLKYRCPNSNCGYEHWLSLLEAQTINFKIVCDCGTVFKPKRVKNIKILYENKKAQKPEQQQQQQKESEKIPDDLIDKSVPSLIDFGFTKEESIELLNKAYTKHPTNDISLLIRNALLEINHG